MVNKRLKWHESEEHSGLDEDKKLAKLIRVTADTIISWELRSVKRGERNMRNAERFLELQQLKPNLSTCQSVWRALAQELIYQNKITSQPNTQFP